MLPARPSPAQLEQLAQSLVIFGRASGQISYAVELFDDYRDKIVPAYHGGRYGHPYAKIAEDKIVLELGFCLDEYNEYFEPLVEGDQPVESRAFFETLRGEEQSLRRLRTTLIARPEGDPAERRADLPSFLHTLPGALGYWRDRGRESLVVFDAIWRHYARHVWFAEVRERAMAMSVATVLGEEAPSQN